jgi:hypothetical protein
VFNNGTDVVEAITNLNNLSLGNVAVGGVITGNGSGISAINASSISTGTLANARTTANSANSASTIVLRDSDGSFAANVVTVSSFSTANFTITQVGTSLVFQYNGTNVAVMTSGGNVTAAGQITAGGSI